MKIGIYTDRYATYVGDTGKFAQNALVFYDKIFNLFLKETLNLKKIFYF